MEHSFALLWRSYARKPGLNRKRLVGFRRLSLETMVESLLPGFTDHWGREYTFGVFLLALKP